MSLKIYSNVDPSSAFSINGTFSNPIWHSFDGINGEVIEKRYFVRNDDVAKWYSSITVQPIDGGDNIVDGSGPTVNYNWKLIAGDQRPLEEQWALKSAGNSIDLSNIGESGTGDTTTYLPFWVRISIPAGASISSYQGVTLKISTEENLV